ncbi:MAG: hypothetical protein SFW64_00565 [Alphaproteobacteria bacterium]|nr:hypothetical protein [Alphaproteobacteria bacterium]
MYLEKLRALCATTAPIFQDIITHNSAITSSTWNAKVETGKAVEFYSLCCLAAGLEKLGIGISIPAIYLEHPDLFYLRNILPRHHGTQAGHSAAINSIPLSDRFVAALTPKFIFETVGSKYGIYREGFPIHLIEHLNKGEEEYLDRPDVLICRGTMTSKLISSERIAFTYESQSGRCEGILRIKNDALIPIISYDSNLLNVPVVGIIECSVSKGDTKAEEQLRRYLAIYSGATSPVSLLINGRRQKCPAYTHEAFIDMDFDNAEAITGFTAVIDRFSKAII